MPLPLQLKSVTLALETLSNNARDVVASLVSEFLVADVSLSKAIEWSPPGSVSLLEFVWTRGLRDAESSRWTVAKLLHSDKNYYKWEFSLALVQAIRRADLGLIQWLLQHFTGCPVEKDVVEAAAREGHLWVLQLLEADQSHDGIQWGDNCLTEAAKGGHWGVVHWLHQRVGTPPHLRQPR